MNELERLASDPLVSALEKAYVVDVHMRVLGPVEAVRAGVEVRLGGPKQRTTLALLVAEVGKVVSVVCAQRSGAGVEPTEPWVTRPHRF